MYFFVIQNCEEKRYNNVHATCPSNEFWMFSELKFELNQIDRLLQNFSVFYEDEGSNSRSVFSKIKKKL